MFAIFLQGQILDQKIYGSILREFYKIRGWDPEFGLQKTDTLCSQGLTDLTKGLDKIGLIIH